MMFLHVLRDDIKSSAKISILNQFKIARPPLPPVYPKTEFPTQSICQKLLINNRYSMYSTIKIKNLSDSCKIDHKVQGA